MIALADWLSTAPPPLALVRRDGSVRYANRSVRALPGDPVAAARSLRARATLRLAMRRGGLRVRLEGAWSDWSAELRPARAADGTKLVAVALSDAPKARDAEIDRLMRLTAADSVGVWRIDRRGLWRWASSRLGGALLVGRQAPAELAEAARRGDGVVDLATTLPPTGQGRFGWVANGGERWLLTGRPTFDAAGRLDGLLGFARAACGRSRAHQAFERLARAAAAADPGFAMYDRDGRLRLASDGYLRLFDEDAAMLSLGACAGDLLAEVTSGERRPPERGELLKFGMTSTCGRRLEVRRRGSGCGGWTESVLDVTPFRAAERALETATRLAGEEGRAKSVFVRSVDDTLHEATQRLGADVARLRASAATLGATAVGYGVLAEPIAEGFRRLRRVAGGVRALTDLEAPWNAPDMMRFDIGRLVAGAVAGHQAMDRDLRVESVDGLEIVADARLVGLALDQLLSNALKFTPPGGRVTVTVAPNPDGGVALTVADTGCGVDPAMLPRLQEPFFQVEKCAIDRNYEGAGVGLALCAAAMRLQGGLLTLDSAPECGFRATLVFAQAGHATPKTSG